MFGKKINLFKLLSSEYANMEIKGSALTIVNCCMFERGKRVLLITPHPPSRSGSGCARESWSHRPHLLPQWQPEGGDGYSVCWLAELLHLPGDVYGQCGSTLCLPS